MEDKVEDSDTSANPVDINFNIKSELSKYQSDSGMNTPEENKHSLS